MTCFFSGTDWSNLEDRGIQSNYFLMLIVNFAGKYCAKVAFKAKKKNSGNTILDFANNSDGFTPMTLSGAAGEKDVLVVMDCNIVHEEMSEEIPFGEELKKLIGELIVKPSVNKKELASLITQAGEALKYVSVETKFEERYEKVKLAIEEEKKAVRVPSGGYIGANGPAYGKNYYDGGTTSKQGEFGWGEEDGNFKYYEDKEWGKGGGKGNGKKKNIMEMTDKEYQKYMKEEQDFITKFTKKHAKVLINAVITKNTKDVDYSSPIDKLMAINLKLKGAIESANWVTEFMFNLRDKFDDLFGYIQADDVDYEDMLTLIEDILDERKYNDLIRQLLIEIRREKLTTMYHNGKDNFRTIRDSSAKGI